MTALSLAAIVRLRPDERQRMFQTYLPWAFANGSKCADLVNVYWEEELETNVDDLRQRLGIERPPDLREIRKKLREQRKLARQARQTVGADGRTS